MKVLTFGEIMLRLKAPGHERFFQSPSLEATFGGGEANVAVSLANYGMDAAFLTVLPKNDIAEACIRELRYFGVDTSRILRGEGRMGIYYLQGGANQLPSKVVYDRAYSAIALAKPGDIDWDRDPRAANQESIDRMDGARLTVTVTFTDGSEQTKTYTLSTGRLKVEYDANSPGGILLPQLAGDEDPWLYGVYAVDETASRFLQWPVQGANTISLSNPYGTPRWQPGGKTCETHTGIDIAAPEGEAVLAAAGGTVVESGYDVERGNYVVIDHGDGLSTLYGQCRDFTVEEGDTVRAGEMIGAVGKTGMATGAHLHFEVRQDGEPQNPVAYFDSDVRDTLRMG